MAPTFTPDRQTFRALVAEVAARAKEKLPQAVNDRVEKAVALVLQGDVEPPAADGSITVYSATDPTRRYVLHGTACTCADYERGQAPQGWCAHRIAAGIQKRVRELVPEASSTPAASAAADNSTPQEPVAPLPEAPARVDCHLVIAGRQVQLTLRDSDEGRLLARLETVLARFPLPDAEALSQRTEQGKGWCAKHLMQMKQTEKNGRTWWSHRTAEGWCKGK